MAQTPRERPEWEHGSSAATDRQMAAKVINDRLVQRGVELANAAASAAFPYQLPPAKLPDVDGSVKMPILGIRLNLNDASVLDAWERQRSGRGEATWDETRTGKTLNCKHKDYFLTHTNMA